MLNKNLFYYLIILVAFALCNASSAKVKYEAVKIAEVSDTKSQLSILSFVSSNDRIPANEKLEKPVLQQQINAWKNERITCQVVVLPGIDLPDFKLALDDDTKDKTIWQDAIHIGFLKNVAANISGGLCGSVPKNLPEVQVADLISNNQSGTIKAGKLQAIWITVHVPGNINPGLHTLVLQPQATGQVNLPKLTLNIVVSKLLLPDANQWNFHLDLWQNPLRVAKYYNVKPWSAQHFEAMKPIMQQLANAGQKAITASFFWDNMNNENYGFDNLMIKVNRNGNAPLQFNFTNFDKWIEFMMSMGIKGQINVFGMYPFTNNLSYYITDAQNKTVTNSFALASDDYKIFWNTFLKAFAAHLKQKGWFDKTIIYFDERPQKNVINVVNIIKQVDAGFKIGYAGAYDATLAAVLYDFSIPSYLKMPANVLSARNSNKQVTTFYTTCLEKKPNLFTYSSPAEAVFMGWYAFANNYNGYLRYALNTWEKNSVTDTRSAIVPAGDKFIIYPDSYSSVRFEKLIEGVQDYEKLNILIHQLQQANNTKALKRIRDMLKNFKIDNVKNISDYPSLMESAKALLNSGY